VIAALPAPATTLADKIGELRRRSGLSFDRLSERSYTNVSYLHALETGKKAHPSRDVLIRIGFGLGVEAESVDELLLLAGHLPLFYNANTK
jgi:transcriptional regulator with XRE-family HTH domain